VNDPKFEASGSAQLDSILITMQKEKGQQAIDNMNKELAGLFSLFSMSLHSYYDAIVSNE
jgi:hypothetical protein